MNEQSNIKFSTSNFSNLLGFQGCNLLSIIAVLSKNHYLKSVRIRSYPGPYFPHSDSDWIRTRIAPDKDTFYAVNEC